MREPKSGTAKPDGEKIKQLRKQKGLTLEEFSKRTGCSSRNLQRAMAGEPVQYQTLRDVAFGLGVPYESLLFNSDFLLTEDEGDYIKIRLELNIPKNAVAPPELLAFLEHLKAIFPGSQSPKLLSIGVGFVIVGVAKSANGAPVRAIQDLWRSFIATPTPVAEETDSRPARGPSDTMF